MQLRILTLNIWGVRYVAKFITPRIKAIIEHLLHPDTNYDIVGLQEVWSKADYIYFLDALKNVYPHSYYFLSGLVGSGCCVFSKYPIVGVYEHRYTLNGFPHKVQHGDWFCGKLIGLCKILINGFVVNVYNTHLHANYHHAIPKDIYLGHRICQAYELIQFIESTSSADTTHLTVLLGDLNLTNDDLGFKLIKGLLKLNDAFLQRIRKDVFDPTVGNSGRTCDLLDNPYVIPHPYQGQGERIDYILYRARNDNVKCIEAYPTLHKVPNSSKGLHYSDHLAVYALFEIDEKAPDKKPMLLQDVEITDEETRNNLLEACGIVEQTIDRLQRDRMEITREIYYILSGITFTILLDLYLSSSDNIFLVLTFIRIVGIFIALFYRIIYDNYDQNSHVNTNKKFWNSFKNISTAIGAIEQAFLMYYMKFSFNVLSILCIIGQISMPLFYYLWIRRIERENFSFLQSIWNEIFHLTNDHDVQSKRTDDYLIIKRLFRYSLPDWKIITFGTVLLLSAALSEVFVPLYTGRLLSSVAFKEAWLQFQYNLIMFIVVNFSGGFLGGFRMGVFSVCISRLNIRLRTELFRSYLRQEIGFFDTHESGKLLSRLNHDTQIMSSTVANNITHWIGALVRFIGTLIMMIKLSIHLTIACLIGAPLILIVAKISGNAHRRISEKVQNLSAEASEIAEETIQTIRTVRSFGNEDEELKRFENTLQQSYHISLIQAALTSAQKWFVDLAQLCMSIVMLSYGAKLVRDNYVTGPDLLAFIIYQLTLGGILSDISQIYTSLMTAAGASQSVFDYLDRQPIQKPNGMLQPVKLQGAIEFQNVSLTYPARPNETAIQNVSFKIKPGQTCAFVGPSGSGKSTCINLLERFYDPNHGKILIDGREIQEYDHKYLHKKISMVGQEPVLFNTSIRENISYAMKNYDETTVIEAAQQANAHDFITELGNGYDTKCGQRGGHLSGGQKQRVSIARAIIRKPTILLLDEATSALDPVNERLIQDALFYKKDQQENRTVVISAHRLSTIERCDRIFVMHKGRLIEQGTHDELIMIENGIYRELVRRQRMNIGDD